MENNDNFKGLVKEIEEYQKKWYLEEEERKKNPPIEEEVDPNTLQGRLVSLIKKLQKEKEEKSIGDEIHKHHILVPPAGEIGDAPLDRELKKEFNLTEIAHRVPDHWCESSTKLPEGCKNYVSTRAWGRGGLYAPNGCHYVTVHLEINGETAEYSFDTAAEYII